MLPAQPRTGEEAVGARQIAGDCHVNSAILSHAQNRF
jgi:hypothetical protein